MNNPRINQMILIETNIVKHGTDILWLLNREQIRGLAKKYNIPRGRNFSDTIKNISNSNKIIPIKITLDI